MFRVRFKKPSENKTLSIVDCSKFVIPDQLLSDHELTVSVLAQAKTIADKRWQERKNKGKKSKVSELTISKEGESDQEFGKEDITTMPKSSVLSYQYFLSLFAFNNKRKYTKKNNK